MDLDNLVENKLKERLDKLEEKVSEEIKVLTKECVKEYITELKLVIFSELTSHLLEKYKDLEQKGEGNYDMPLDVDKIKEINI
jgi:uncharacterized coiled-coil protein SlyX